MYLVSHISVHTMALATVMRMVLLFRLTWTLSILLNLCRAAIDSHPAAIVTVTQFEISFESSNINKLTSNVIDPGSSLSVQFSD